MQYRWISLSLAGVLLLGSPLARAADEAKPAAKPASTQPAKAPSKATAPAKKPKPVDINSASAEQLTEVSGRGRRAGREDHQEPAVPDAGLPGHQGVYSQDDYYKIKDYFVAVPPAEAKTKPKK